MKMGNALHSVFILAKTMNRVKLIAFSNSKWKLMTALVRFILFLTIYLRCYVGREFRVTLFVSQTRIGKRQFCKPTLRS